MSNDFVSINGLVGIFTRGLPLTPYGVERGESPSLEPEASCVLVLKKNCKAGDL